MEAPDRDEILAAFSQGYCDGTARVPVGDNPYAETDECLHWEWLAGWAAAGLERANASAEARQQGEPQ